MDTHEPSPPDSPPAPGRRLLLPLVLAFVAGAAVGAGALKLAARSVASPARPPAARSEAPKAKLYQCPMHPSITSDHPGDCPICGMKLVEVTSKPEPQKHGEAPSVQGMAEVTIDPGRQQLIGLRTATVRRGPIAGTWRTVASIQVAPSHVRKTNVKVEGFVERVFVDFVGQSVRKGQPLFSIYSPGLLAAQNEYLLALSSRDALAKAGGLSENGDTLVKAARRRLQLWDVPEAEIDRLTATREPSKTLTLLSPIAGVVTAKNVVQGTRLAVGDAPYEITDLGEVWVMADAYQSDISRIRPRMKATLTLPAYPNRTFPGMVAFIDPLLDPQTRTVKVHLHFGNPTRELKPGMFGEVTLQGLARDGLQIPSDAVIHAGTRDVVFVALAGGRFQPRTVELGAKDGEMVEVKSGLEEGLDVVVRANFLVDSESQLRASLAAIGGK
jgi:membrane fusion protein, copper/silver efflux system